MATINMRDVTRALDILTEVDLDKGSKASNRKLVKLTEQLSDRQRKLMSEEQLAAVKDGNIPAMKALLGKSVWNILLRQGSNALAVLATHTRQAIPRTTEEVDILLKASKGDHRSNADRLAAAELIKRIGEAEEARAKKPAVKKTAKKPSDKPAAEKK